MIPLKRVAFLCASLVGVLLFEAGCENQPASLGMPGDARYASSTMEADSFANRAIEKEKRGDHEGALRDFTEAITLCPKVPVFYAYRGMVKGYKHDYAGAMADYSQALLLNPRLEQAYVGRAILKKNMGNPDGAIADYDRVIAIYPTDTGALYNRGVAKLAKGDVQGAIADYKQAIAVFPTNSFAYHGLGQIVEVSGDIKGAIENYEMSIKVEPQRATYVRFALLLLLRSEHMDESAAGLPAALDSWTDEWGKTVGHYLCGSIVEPDFLAAARQGDAETVQHHLCEAFYYVGMTHLIKGEDSVAKSFFERCVGTHVTRFYEYEMATIELGRLGKGSKHA